MDSLSTSYSHQFMAQAETASSPRVAPKKKGGFHSQYCLWVGSRLEETPMEQPHTLHIGFKSIQN